MDAVVDTRPFAAIRRAVSDYDLTESSAWADLAILGSNVIVDGFELDEDSVTLSADHTFKAIAYIYLVLEYGKGEGGFSTSESFRADIAGVLNGEAATISSVAVDASPFYD